MTRHKVLFLCTGNSCRSQMAEGLVKHIGFPDPTEAKGSDEEKLAVFRQVRDEIRDLMLAYLKN